MTDEIRVGFEYDMFLGGPPDRRVDVPYRELIKKAFPDLRIYDWESYKGDDYQKHNNEMLKKSLMMVSWVPIFRMPGIGPEVGYFYGAVTKSGLNKVARAYGSVVKPTQMAKPNRNLPNRFTIQS